MSEANSAHHGIESLPPEILSYIFIIGSDNLIYEDISAFGDNDNMNDINNDDSDEETHFATLCSSVCQYWRDIAINTCQLWSSLIFDGSEVSLERSTVWLARSKDVPLSILVDLPDSEGKIAPTSRGGSDMSDRILELILPHVLRWKIFALQADSNELIFMWQTRLALLSSAPILEHIEFHCSEEWFDEHASQPPMFRSPPVIFPSGTPNIRSVDLWGVHLDWESVTFFTGLESLHLAWHTKDVRPTTEQFVQALIKSPKLETLYLEGSAPSPGAWPQERIILFNLRRLGLGQIDLSDALSVVDHIEFPALSALKLDLEVENVGMLIRAFCQPKKLRLGSLQVLRVVSFQCSRDDGKLFLSTLANVKSMILDFNYLPVHFCGSLSSFSPLLCPKLETLKLSGLAAKHVIALIKARKRSPTPIRRLLLDEDDHFSYEAMLWLRGAVETVGFFENSDVETGSEEDDEENEWTDDSQGPGGSNEIENDEEENNGGGEVRMVIKNVYEGAE